MYLYHMLLREGRLRDEMIYTLNELRVRHPDLYDLHAAKYQKRPKILEQQIPHLNCSWSDVVFLSPVHPDQVCAALALFRQRSVPPLPYLTIPLADLEPEKLVIWLFQSRDFNPAEVVPFNRELVERSQEIPEITKTYFREQREKQEVALFFFRLSYRCRCYFFLTVNVTGHDAIITVLETRISSAKQQYFIILNKEKVNCTDKLKVFSLAHRCIGMAIYLKSCG